MTRVYSPFRRDAVRHEVHSDGVVIPQFGRGKYHGGVHLDAVLSHGCLRDVCALDEPGWNDEGVRAFNGDVLVQGEQDLVGFLSLRELALGLLGAVVVYHVRPLVCAGGVDHGVRAFREGEGEDLQRAVVALVSGDGHRRVGGQSRGVDGAPEGPVPVSVVAAHRSFGHVEGVFPGLDGGRQRDLDLRLCGHFLDGDVKRLSLPVGQGDGLGVLLRIGEDILVEGQYDPMV